MKHVERQMYTVREFLHRNNIGRTTFFELVKRGDVRVVKMGKKTLIPAESEREWQASLPMSLPMSQGPVEGEPERTSTVKDGA